MNKTRQTKASVDGIEYISMSEAARANGVNASTGCNRFHSDGFLNWKIIGQMTKEDHFWKRVVKKNSGCWEWHGNLNEGYGCLNIGNGKMMKAHRFSYEIHYDCKIPEGVLVRHKCDNRKCVNPHHLMLGTNKDNTLDKDKFIVLAKNYKPTDYYKWLGVR